MSNEADPLKPLRRHARARTVIQFGNPADIEIRRRKLSGHARLPHDESQRTDFRRLEHGILSIWRNDLAQAELSLEEMAPIAALGAHLRLAARVKTIPVGAPPAEITRAKCYLKARYKLIEEAKRKNPELFSKIEVWWETGAMLARIERVVDLANNVSSCIDSADEVANDQLVTHLMEMRSVALRFDREAKALEDEVWKLNEPHAGGPGGRTIARILYPELDQFLLRNLPRQRELLLAALDQAIASLGRRSGEAEKVETGEVVLANTPDSGD